MRQQENSSAEDIRVKLRQQLEYYFSKNNLINDVYLQSQMDKENYVFISIIANFKLVKRLTDDLRMIIDVLKEMPSVEVNSEENKVRSSDRSTYHYNRKRCIIILRNVPIDANETEIKELFANERCQLEGIIECERILQSNHNDCWYVKFSSEDDAQRAFVYLTSENVIIREQKILARFKSQLSQRPTETSSMNNVQVQSLPLAYTNNSTRFAPIYLPVTNYSTNFPSFRPMTNVQPLIGNYPVYPTTAYWFLPSFTDSSSTIFPFQSFARSVHQNHGAQGKKSRHHREQRDENLNRTSQN